MKLPKILNFLNRGEQALAGSPKGTSAIGKSNPSAVKVPKAAQTRAAYFSSASVGSGQPLAKPDRSLINTDITSYRRGQNTSTIIRDFAIATPDLSASVDAYIRTAVTKSYTAVAKNLDGTFNAEATKALQTLLVQLDTLNNYEEGFSTTPSIRAVAEALAKEMRYHGAAALELVLDKARLPLKLQPVAVATLSFLLEKDGIVPVQKVSNETINLDIPTFFYRAIDQDLLTPYANSPMEAALQPVLFMQEFLNDLRRVVKQALYPRMKVKITAQDIMASMPPEYRETPEKTQQYIQATVDAVADEINGLNPEDALVLLDTLDVEYMHRGNASFDTEISAMRDIINAKTATGVKTLPSILGQGSTSSNIASTESLLFMKSAEGVQFALNDLLSQALTLATRLYGYDVYVEFEFERIDLRPDSELEAFRAMKQSNTLTLLSYGILTDEDAAIKLTGKLPPEGAPKLSGTMFMTNSTPNVPNNPYSGTSQGTLNQTLNSDAPKNAKGQNGGKDGNR
nr:MAG TPA: portal [Caudoviricetes sp.]